MDERKAAREGERQTAATHRHAGDGCLDRGHDPLILRPGLDAAVALAVLSARRRVFSETVEVLVAP